MMRTTAIVITVWVLGLQIAAPYAAFAASPPFPYPLDGSRPLLTCTGVASGPGGVKCWNFCQLIDTATNVVYFMLTLAVFVFAPILIVIGGIMIMLGGTSPSQIQTGKRIIYGTVIGIAIGLGAYLIVNVVYGALTGGTIAGIPPCDRFSLPFLPST